MVGDADADSIKVVIVKMVKVWVFGQYQGEFAGEIFANEGFCIICNISVFRNSIRVFGD